IVVFLSLLLYISYSVYFSFFFFFFFHDPPTTAIYTLSLHDALPISLCACILFLFLVLGGQSLGAEGMTRLTNDWSVTLDAVIDRSEEHTFELQSPYDLVCRLLLEKKKNILPHFRPITYLKQMNIVIH